MFWGYSVCFNCLVDKGQDDCKLNFFLFFNTKSGSHTCYLRKSDDWWGVCEPTFLLLCRKIQEKGERTGKLYVESHLSGCVDLLYISPLPRCSSTREMFNKPPAACWCEVALAAAVQEQHQAVPRENLIKKKNLSLRGGCCWEVQCSIFAPTFSQERF